jgi:hypothetical protein
MEKIKIFDPTTSNKVDKINFVPRPGSLKNLRIGLVDNAKFNSDKLLNKIALILENDYGAKSHIIRRKHNPGVPAHDEMINELASSCDVVISGIGD